MLLKMYVDQHMKRQAHKIHLFEMFITADCFLFLKHDQFKARVKKSYPIFDENG